MREPCGDSRLVRQFAHRPGAVVLKQESLGGETCLAAEPRPVRLRWSVRTVDELTRDRDIPQAPGQPPLSVLSGGTRLGMERGAELKVQDATRRRSFAPCVRGTFTSASAGQLLAGRISCAPDHRRRPQYGNVYFETSRTKPLWVSN